MNFTSIFRKEVKTIHGVRAFRKKLSKKGPGAGRGEITGKTRLRSTGVETGKRHRGEATCAGAARSDRRDGRL